MDTATLPTFPRFEHLTLAHRGAIDDYMRSCSPYTEFTFGSMWCWDLDGSAALSLLNDNLVLRYTDFVSGSSYLSFLGSNERRETALTLLKYSAATLANSHLCFVPEVSIPSDWQGNDEKLYVQADRDNFDYVLDLQEMATFTGPSYRRKRQRAARFERLYSPIVCELDLTNPQDQALARSVFSDWSVSRGKSVYEVEKEWRALQRIFTIWNRSSFLAIGVIACDRLVAISICELLPNKFAMGMFSKADVRMDGAFEFLRRCQANRLTESGFNWINIQQDMGLPGLRQAKMSYHPISFLRKYTLRLRSARESMSANSEAIVRL